MHVIVLTIVLINIPICILKKIMSKNTTLVINSENFKSFQNNNINYFLNQDSIFKMSQDLSVPNKIWICHDINILSCLDDIHQSSMIIIVLRRGDGVLNLRLFQKNINSKNLIFVYDGSAADQAAAVSGFIDINSYATWEPLVSAGFVNDDVDYFRIFYRTLAAKINVKSLYRATQIQTSYLFLRNSLINAVLANFHMPVKGFNNSQVDKPILIVAAGPSLNKQLPILRQYQHLFVILAVDTVWPILTKNDITPNVLFALDSRSKPSWDKNQISNETCFAVDIGCAPRLVWSNNKNHMFTTTSLGIMGLLGRMGVYADVLPTGGSVATSAFGFGRLLGGNPIVLIGQDLALTDGKDHADGYMHTYSEITLKSRTNDGFDVEGYYGHPVRTERQLLFYKTWYENQIKEYSQTMVINSTEGGAKISGSLQIPFKNVCEELESFGISKNFEFLKHQIKFDDKHLLMLSENIELLIEKTRSFIDVAKKGESIVEKRNGRSLKNLLKNIDKINHEIKNFDPDARTVVDAFSQVKMQKIIYQVATDTADKKMDTAIDKYLDIYLGIQESGLLGLAMLEQVRDFYKVVLNRRSYDPNILDEFFN